MAAQRRKSVIIVKKEEIVTQAQNHSDTVETSLSAEGQREIGESGQKPFNLDHNSHNKRYFRTTDQRKL